MYSIVKRLMDIALAGAALVLLVPVFLPVMLILRFTGEREVFYRQRRLGLRGSEFHIFKFVTMRRDSPASGTITAKGDPRILPVGRFLRHTKINELPQLLNILTGDMSIVGPRPLTQEAFDLYPEELKPLVYRTKPGLTGIGSVVFRNEEEILAASHKTVVDCYREEIMPVKGVLEVWYARRRSFVTDLKIIVLTALAILFPSNQLHRSWFADLPLAPGEDRRPTADPARAEPD